MWGLWGTCPDPEEPVGGCHRPGGLQGKAPGPGPLNLKLALNRYLCGAL